MYDPNRQTGRTLRMLEFVAREVNMGRAKDVHVYVKDLRAAQVLMKLFYEFWVNNYRTSPPQQDFAARTLKFYCGPVNSPSSVKFVTMEDSDAGHLCGTRPDLVQADHTVLEEAFNRWVQG